MPLGADVGLNFSQSGAHFTRVLITNEIEATNYGEYGAGYECLAGEVAKSINKSTEVPFSIDIELVDCEMVKQALLEANPKEELEKGRHFGPGFPTIMVGPNGGGKSVSISMIQAFTEFLDEVAPLIVSTHSNNMHFGVADMGSVWHLLSDMESLEGKAPIISSGKLIGIMDRFDWLGNAWKCEFEIVFSNIGGAPMPGLVKELEVQESRIVMEVRRGLKEGPDAGKLDQVKISYALDHRSPHKESGYVMIMIDPIRNFQDFSAEKMYPYWDGWQSYSKEEMQQNYTSDYEGLVCVFPSAIYGPNSGVGNNFLPFDRSKEIGHRGSSLREMVKVFLRMGTEIGRALDVYDQHDGIHYTDDMIEEMYGDIDDLEILCFGDLDYLWEYTSSILNQAKVDIDRRNDAIACLDGLKKALVLDSKDRLFDTGEIEWKGLLVDTQRRDLETGRLKSPSNRTAVSIGRSIQSSMDIIRGQLNRTPRITRFDNESLNSKRIAINPSDLSDQDLDEQIIKLKEWEQQDFNPKGGGSYQFPALHSTSKEYDEFPPFKLHRTLEETILKNRLIVAIDEHRLRLPHGPEKDQVESFLYGQGVKSAWFEVMRGTALAEAYRMVFEWKNGKKTMKNLINTLDAVDEFALELDKRNEKLTLYQIIKSIKDSYTELNNPMIEEGIPTILPSPGSDYKPVTIKSIQRDHRVSGKVTQAALSDDSVRKIWEKERKEEFIEKWYQSKNKNEIITRVRELVESQEYTESSVEDALDFDDVLYSFISEALDSLTEFASISSRLGSLSSKMSDFLEIDVSIRPDGLSDFPDMDSDLDEIELNRLQRILGVPYLSSGQAQLFTILTEMEMAPQVVRHVLIDEPELSLHDKFVTDLFEYMCEFSKSTGKQVICSTHSTTLAGLGLRHSVFVEKQGGKNE